MPLPSLFQPANAQRMLDRIRRLRLGTPALWGKMDVAQMLAHCQPPLRVALGELELKRSLAGRLFGKLAKKMLVSDTPWKPGLPTDKSFLVKDARDFASEQRKLLDVVERFTRAGPAGITQKPHPFFGPMTPAEWDAGMAKHLDHHLRQFGA